MPDADVYDLNPEALCLRIHAIADVDHQFGAFAREHSRECLRTEDTAHIRSEDRLQTHIGHVLVRQRLVEPQRIGDAPACVSIDDQAFTVLRDYLFGRQIQHEHALVEIKHVLERPGQFDVQTGRADDLTRLSNLQHQCLLCLVNGKQSRQRR